VEDLSFSLYLSFYLIKIAQIANIGTDSLYFRSKSFAEAKFQDVKN
jgi:hypothetical protein